MLPRSAVRFAPWGRTAVPPPRHFQRLRTRIEGTMTQLTIPSLTILDECVMTITRDHSGEKDSDIWDRKIADIATNPDRRTYWYYAPVHKSPGTTTPDIIQNLCMRRATRGGTWCLIMPPASKQASTNETSSPATRHAATHWSQDQSNWIALRTPPDLTPVTWEDCKTPCALVFDFLARPSPAMQVDLSHFDYLQFNSGPAATRLAMRRRSAIGSSNLRPLVLIGHLVDPYAVWLRE
jgi:hypothetical protein